MNIAPDLGVQVGDAGSLHLQGSDERWAPAYTGVDEYLRGATMLNGRIIAAGENGRVIWSDDGAAFNIASLNPPNPLDWFEGVAASGQKAVAVGDHGTIYLSADGETWNASTSGTTEWLRGVAFGAGAFVAVGENGVALRSSDGAAWNAVDAGTSEHLNRVRYLGGGGSGRFIAVGDNGVALESVDGAAPWTALNSGVTNDLYDVAMNNLGTLLAGDDALLFKATSGGAWVDQISETDTNAAPPWVYLSARGKGSSWLVAGRAGLLIDGDQSSSSDIVWTPTPLNSSRAWIWDMTERGGLRVAVGDLGDIQTSLDGILWTREAVPVARTNTVLLGVGGTTNTLLAVGNDGNVLVSLAGLTEIAVTNELGPTNIVVEGFGVVWSNQPSFTTGDLQGVAAVDGLFALCGEGGSIFTSPDGFDWTSRPTPVSSFLSSVAIGADALVAVGDGGALLRSTDDGATWTRVAMPTTDWLYRVRWIKNQFIVAGENGALFTSPDGAAWTERVSGTTKWLTDATSAEGQWFVTGYQGTLLSSSNLVDWTAAPLPTGKSLFAASSRDGQLLVAGVDGVILRNQIVAKTTPVQVLEYNQTVSVGTNGVAGVYELFLFGGEPDQFFDLNTRTNLTDGAWTNVNGGLELYDASGTLYAIRTRDATNAPPAEYYQTRLIP